MWVITRKENQYDQMGSYFVAAFSKKPTKEILKAAIPKINSDQDDEWSSLDIDDDFPDHLLKGGGRRNGEPTWYYLEEVADYSKIKL
jgi:hypothetical protein